MVGLLANDTKFIPTGGRHEAFRAGGSPLELLGPVVFRLAIDDLAGTHLANYDLVLREVHLERDERERYEREVLAFGTWNRAFRRVSPEASGVEFVRAAMGSVTDRQALAAWRESQRIQAFPWVQAESEAR